MVPDGRLGKERIGVGGAVLLVRETAPQKDMVSDASFKAVGGLGVETMVYWRYNLTGEERASTIRSGK